jgi:hypothetical protein
VPEKNTFSLNPPKSLSPDSEMPISKLLAYHDFDSHCKQYPAVVTFEPGTLNLEPLRLGYK